MIQLMIIVALVLLLSVFSSKLLYRFGIPTLLIFMGLGMLFGSDGIVGIQFDNYNFARDICSFGLVFIMFYGGFGTNWNEAKPVAVKAVLMSTVGVIVTALLTGIFCYFILDTSLLEGLLIGSVLASTDAASVFAVLRSRKLNLKNGLASLLEIESGSNDPISYMLTISFLSFLTNPGGESLVQTLFIQISIGLILGFLIAIITAYTLSNILFEIDGLYSIYTIAVVILAYSMTEYLGGNGYLAVYIVGIVVGNSKIKQKRNLVHFFDGISWLMQIILFFTLGLLSFPSHFSNVAVSGIFIAVFMIFVARPAATFSILSWFKIPIKQQLLVSWVGLRGAASIVFAIYAVTSGGIMDNDIFHIVFIVALFSVSVQGSLIPFIAKKLDLVESNVSVLKTFNDYEDEALTQLMEFEIQEGNPWVDKTIATAHIPKDILVVMIRRNEESIVPKGDTQILTNDILILSGTNFDNIPC